MTRSLGVDLQAVVSAERAERVYLYELEYSNGALRITNAPADIEWNGFTWDALGGLLIHESVNESRDMRQQGVRVELSGVEGSIISRILNNNFKGRPARIYLCHLDMETAEIVGEPHLVFRGRQNSPYIVREEHDEDGSGTVTVETRIVSILARIQATLPIRTNVKAHSELLRRAGATLGDLFFVTVPEIVNKKIYWGREAPAESTGSSFTGHGAGGGNGDRNDRDRV